MCKRRGDRNKNIDADRRKGETEGCAKAENSETRKQSNFMSWPFCSLPFVF